ncbi:hypothetical protein PUNSTDRAFT_40238, partial [Punctularia strigosozonata HHB-11173 SS5]|uniref:uncharacterized protein n=1 Tax=Punctularia strigosozonata (strain HHB-11173) TaxID=741275 RepID=UPI0004416BE2
ISLACLNLPIEVRYHPENLYIVGLVPGPKEPTLTALNQYIRLVVDDMLVGWHDGFYLLRTSLHENGRLIRTAIANAVCDLPAARKTAALAASTSRIFCSVCDCWHPIDPKDKTWRCTKLGRVDYEQWNRRDVDEMCAAAERWRDASSPEERKLIFKETGVRWSDLWRLPYWDPTQQLVVNGMHCLLEGIASFHYINVLG